ncbi:MAG: glycosyltransferase [Cyanobacteria bacterium J06635_10]
MLSNAPFVSVIIPVFNDSKRLKKCLTKLESQSYPRNRFEVIVIDNNSEESLKDTFDAFQKVHFLLHMN